MYSLNSKDIEYLVGKNIVKSITMKQLEEIAKEKMVDLNAVDLKGAVNMVKGSAVSMGMEVGS